MATFNHTVKNDMIELEAFQNIQLKSLLDSSISLLTAFILGSLIGYERQYRQRNAGLRTNVLVCIGAAAFVDIANRLHGHDGAVHVIAYVVSGIGFLGAGVLMKEKGNISGLNTAATLWASAAVGAAAGADLIVESVIVTLFVLASNTVLRPIARRINRQPIEVEQTELGYSVYVIMNNNDYKNGMRQLELLLEGNSLPVISTHVHPFGANAIEAEIKLGAESVTEAQLDSLIEQLITQPMVNQAFWSHNQEG